ncbi:MAG: P-type conjugative transfer ATPase TrbB, partial [Mesorhizobium sp.]
MSSHPEADHRRRVMLRTALGPAITEALADPSVIEVMVNPDGALRLDRLGEGRVNTGVHLHPSEAERIIRLVASHVRVEAHADNPIVSAELPSGERFEGLLPPVVLAPCFAIRKPAAKLYTLADYVADRIMLPLQVDVLKRAVRERRNILVAGGTSSGKTTLANALLAEVAECDERVILIEDTRELQCAARDCVALRTRRG